MLNWILKKYGVKIGSEFIWLRIKSSGRLM
jgi:hypothetical protein